MDNTYVIDSNGELYHWGIRGMKWGIRRYQNKDGSLTPAGRKRYDNEEAELKAREKKIKGREKMAAKKAKLDAKRAELDAREEALKGGKGKDKKAKSEESRPKTMREMTDDELRAHTTRMQLEKQYIDAQKNLIAATPQKVSAGKQFMDSLTNDVIIPAAKNAGKEWVEKTMKDKLGLNDKVVDPLKKLENKYKTLEWETKIKDLQAAGTLKDKKEPSYEDLNKKEAYRKTRADKVSGLEDLQRYRKQLEAIYGNNAQDKIEERLKKRAAEYGIDYGED